MLVSVRGREGEGDRGGGREGERETEEGGREGERETEKGAGRGRGRETERQKKTENT